MAKGSQAAKEAAPKKTLPKRETDVQIVIEPSEGKVTYDSEGAEGGKWAIRYLHVPSSDSGLTIGRGYDMKEKSEAQILADLKTVGVADDMAKKVAKGKGLKGEVAKKFITDNKLEEFSITPQQQSELFKISYRDEAAEAKRVATKDDVQGKYGKFKWDELHPAIREMVVDLKYRGDYTPTTRQTIQKAIAENDLAAFTKHIGDKKLWANVPTDRFNRRKKFMDEALKKEQAKQKKLPPNTKTGKSVGNPFIIPAKNSKIAAPL